MGKYITLNVHKGRPFWGVFTSGGPIDYPPDAYAVTDTNDEYAALRAKLAHYLLGQGPNQKWFDASKYWTREVAIDCMANPEKYRYNRLWSSDEKV